MLEIMATFGTTLATLSLAGVFSVIQRLKAVEVKLDFLIKDYERDKENDN